MRGRGLRLRSVAG